MWLGLPHGKLMVEECQGKHTSCQRSGKEWDHYQSCLRINGCSKKTRRHDGMVYNLAWCLRSGLNLDPKIEPKYLDIEGRKRRLATASSWWMWQCFTRTEWGDSAGA